MADKADDLNLPAAVVARLIKEALPEGVNISKEARTAVSKAASVFVLYTTACANTHAVKHKRKTLTGPDVLSAMDDMEFGQFIPILQEAVDAFKKEQKEKKEQTEKKKKAAVEAVLGSSTVATDSKSSSAPTLGSSDSEAVATSVTAENGSSSQI
ncbi:DNA polymerase epsilon subunit 3-like [Corticium candelabrum]|uniref:DNA polymerase epsilon subunit 3-like n=1 Tax=Corticium candelabrum TaxID=121492 RepID=UPI002E256044|nr:DNA polymerase epsilon subunit 3-like [Corticium candelabrum]